MHPGAKLDWHIHPGGNTCSLQKEGLLIRKKARPQPFAKK
jgi:hypothetical protein